MILVSLELKPLFVLQWERKRVSNPVHEAAALVLTQQRRTSAFNRLLLQFQFRNSIPHVSPYTHD